MSARQQAYLTPSNGKTHVLTIDGVVAGAAGIKFLELENGVIIARGIDGRIPPCCITGIWSNTNMGRRCRDSAEAKSDNPKVKPTTEMPDHGPPLVIQCFSRPTHVENPVPERPKTKARLTRRVSSPHDQMNFPEPPPRTGTPTSPRLARSPTPSQLSLPENERPPSWEESVLGEQIEMGDIVDEKPEYENMRRIPDAFRQLPPGHLNVDPEAILQTAPSPFEKAHPHRRHIAPPFMAVLPCDARYTMPPESIGEMSSQSNHAPHFRGVQPARMRPNHAVAPYPRAVQPTPLSGKMMTYEEVEAMINARMHPPPQSMLPPVRHYARPPPEQLHDERAYREPVLRRLAYEAREPASADIAGIEGELAIPPNAKFEDLVYRARMFDQPANKGGWRPRPPPSPLGPVAQARLSWAQQPKDDQVYRPRVRRANIPQEKQKKPTHGSC